MSLVHVIGRLVVTKVCHFNKRLELAGYPCPELSPSSSGEMGVNYFGSIKKLNFMWATCPNRA